MYFWRQQRYVLLMVHSEQQAPLLCSSSMYYICSMQYSIVVHSVSHIATDSHYETTALLSYSSYPVVQSQIETLAQQMHVGEGEVVSRQLAPAQRAALCSRHHCSTDCISSPMAAPQRHPRRGGGLANQCHGSSSSLQQYRDRRAQLRAAPAPVTAPAAPSPTGGTQGGELSIRVAAPRTRAAFNYTFSVFLQSVSCSFYRVATQ